jgi:hypothetical protein
MAVSRSASARSTPSAAVAILALLARADPGRPRGAFVSSKNSSKSSMSPAAAAISKAPKSMMLYAGGWLFADRATRAMFKIVRRLDPDEDCNELPPKT